MAGGFALLHRSAGRCLLSDGEGSFQADIARGAVDQDLECAWLDAPAMRCRVEIGEGFPIQLKTDRLPFPSPVDPSESHLGSTACLDLLQVEFDNLAFFQSQPCRPTARHERAATKAYWGGVSFP